MYEAVAIGKSAVEACADAVRASILRGDLAVGTRLPPERELAESLGVSRGTVRGAVAHLAAAGLLTSRQGRGTTVQNWRLAGGPELISWLAAVCGPEERVHLVADVLEVRRSLAGMVLERLHGASAAALSEAHAAVDDMAALVAAGADLDSLAGADLHVLDALLTATGSTVLALCMNPMVAVLTDFEVLQRAMYSEPETNVAAYRMMLAGLTIGQPGLRDQMLAVLAQRDADTMTRLAEAETRGEVVT